MLPMEKIEDLKEHYVSFLEALDTCKFYLMMTIEAVDSYEECEDLRDDLKTMMECTIDLIKEVKEKYEECRRN